MSGPMHGREPNRFRDARPVLRAVRRPQDDGVEPERWSVEIDNEADDLADSLDIDPGTPIPVDSGDTFDTAAGPGPIDASGNDWHRNDDQDNDRGEDDDGPAGALVLAGDPDDRGPGSAAAQSGVIVPWSGRAVEQREVIPAWLRSSEERRAAAAYAKARAFHLGKYHGARVPLYAARLARRAPAGASRIIVHTARWVGDTESKDVRAKAAKDADATDYLRVSNQHRELVRSRATMAAVLTGLVALGIGALVVAGGTAVQALTVVVVLLVLGVIGRSPDKPVIDHAVVIPRARKLTADIVVRAFVGAKLCKDDAPITFPQPIQRDGNGWRAVIDLPYGTTADQAIKRRTEVASGLDLDEVQVWLDRVRGTSGSARRLVLWVADEDPYAKPSGAWPWLGDPTTSSSSSTAAGGRRSVVKGEASVFEPFPFGQDQRGRAVDLVLMFTWLLVAAIPRMGKTFAARLVVLAAALDPYVRLHVYDGKGGADWRPFTRIAHRVGLGAREDVVRALRDDLADLVDEMNRRYDLFGTLPVDRCPDGKITPALARDPKLGLTPIVTVIDECQRYFSHKEYGPQIVDLLIELAKVGPAAGIMGVVATQKPDPESIPTKLRDVIGTRFCLKVMTWQSSDAALGAGAYSAGWDASRFQRAHKGVGWLLGADDSGAVEEAVTVRTYLASGDGIDKVIARAHAARVTAGTLTGAAIGDLPQPAENVSVLADIAAVFAPGEDRLWSELILHRLAELRPGFYDGWNTAQLAAAVKPHGLSTVQVWGTTGDGQPANRRGLTREAVMTALRTQTSNQTTSTPGGTQNPQNPQSRPQDRPRIEIGPPPEPAVPAEDETGDQS
jgi:DNA segregation ATPase FtsK/SpoIIIE, S-DNA-T family